MQFDFSNMHNNIKLNKSPKHHLSTKLKFTQFEKKIKKIANRLLNKKNKGNFIKYDISLISAF